MVEGTHALINEWPQLETIHAVEQFFTPRPINPRRQSCCASLGRLCGRVWSVVKEPFDLLLALGRRNVGGHIEETPYQQISIKLKTKQVWSRLEALISNVYWGRNLLVPTINAIRRSDIDICLNPPMSSELMANLYLPEPVMIDDGPLNKPTEICLGASLWFIKSLLSQDADALDFDLSTKEKAREYYHGAPLQSSILQWLYTKVRIVGTDHTQWLAQRKEFSVTIGGVKDVEKQKKRIDEQVETELLINKIARLEIEGIYCGKPQITRVDLPEGVYLVRVPKHAAVFYKVSNTESYIFNIDYGLILLQKTKDQWTQLLHHFKGYNAVPMDEQYLHLMKLSDST